MFSNIKNLLRKVNFGFTLLLVASAAVAQTADNYVPLVGTGGYTNFKTSYTPEALNVSSTSSVVTLRTRHSGLGQSRVKIFVPPGAKKLRTSIITYAVNEPARAAARFALPPISLVSDVVPDVNGSTDVRKTLENLQNGQELRFYSPERSGVLMVATADAGSTYQGNKGGYIYLNFFSIPGGSFMSFDTQVEVEKTCYQSWYNSINQSNAWTSAGNPRDEDTHTCAGSDGGSVVVPPALTGIALSRTSWNAATDAANTAITVTPQPAGAVLPTCTPSLPNLLTAGPASATGAQFVINPAALTATTAVTVTCGDKTATLNLQPADTVALVQTKKLTAVDGLAQLAVTLKHTDAELAANTKVNYWVVAMVPRGFPFFVQDEWFFRSALDTGGFEWKQLTASLDVAPLIFKKAEHPYLFTTTKLQSLTIPLGFSAVEFKNLGIKIDLWYNQNDGGYQRVGTIWDFTTDGAVTTPVTTAETPPGA